MEILGIKFVPLSESLQVRLYTLSAAIGFFLMSFGMPVSFLLTIYSIFYTQYWWLTLIYLYFCYTDAEICKKGGKPSQWVRSWTLWKYYVAYFPLKAHLAGTKKFYDCKNYLLACYPHGMLPTAIVGCMGSTFTNWQQMFPNHETRFSTINAHYYVPVFRELMLGLGGIASDAAAISHVLNKPQGGNFVALMPGGAEEAFYCNPGEYKIVLKKRKGFVKLALRTGANLVPVYTFGESSLFRQSKNKFLLAVLRRIKKMLGFAVIFPIGRGLFQYSFGLIQLQVPLNVVVGDPIEVRKSENPTLEEIDELHQKYINALLKLFEQEKHKYIKNPENVHLELVS